MWHRIETKTAGLLTLVLCVSITSACAAPVPSAAVVPIGTAGVMPMVISSKSDFARARCAIGG
eukprot:9301127-Alexandrium_andersonii.AAC.1